MKPLQPIRFGLLLTALTAIGLSAQTAADFDASAEGKKLRRDHAGAIADWTKAIELDPTLATRYLNRAAAKRALGDFAGAIADLDQAIARQPDDANAYCTRGRIKLGTGDLNEVIADEDKALALKPDLMMAWYTRGTARLARGDFESAIGDFDHAIAVAPDSDLHGFFSRYYRYFALRRLQRSADLTELASKLAAWNGGWNKTIGLYLVNALPEKDFMAQAEEGNAKTVRERHHDVYFYVGMNRLLAGDAAGARDLFEKCVALHNTHFAEYPIARAELTRLEPHP